MRAAPLPRTLREAQIARLARIQIGFGFCPCAADTPVRSLRRTTWRSHAKKRFVKGHGFSRAKKAGKGITQRKKRPRIKKPEHPVKVNQSSPSPLFLTRT
jgi:hypothetical protein